MTTEAAIYVRFCRGANSAYEYGSDQNTRELWVGPCIFRLVWGQIELWSLRFDEFYTLCPETGPNVTRHPDWQMDAFKIEDTYYSDVQIHTDAPEGVTVLTIQEFFELIQQ